MKITDITITLSEQETAEYFFGGQDQTPEVVRERAQNRVRLGKEASKFAEQIANEMGQPVEVTLNECACLDNVDNWTEEPVVPAAG